MTELDPHSRWMAEHVELYPAANAPGLEDTTAMELAGRMIDAERALLNTPARTLLGNHLRCLTVVKISADGNSIPDAKAKEIAEEADALLAVGQPSRAEVPTLIELEAAFNLFDHALIEYQRLRAISDAMPLGSAGEDEAVDAHCGVLDHLIENVRAPDFPALRIKFELIDARCADGGGWFETYRRGFMEDLDYLEAQEGPAR